MSIARVCNQWLNLLFNCLLLHSWICCGGGVGAKSDKFTFHENISDATDFENYFETYGFVYEQKRMLEDEIRMKSYHDAILGNADYFQGKVVLDVGAGTGILSMWAAQAGAVKVVFFSICQYVNSL